MNRTMTEYQDKTKRHVLTVYRRVMPPKVAKPGFETYELHHTDGCFHRFRSARKGRFDFILTDTTENDAGDILFHWSVKIRPGVKIDGRRQPGM